MMAMKREGENRIKGGRDVVERKRNVLVLIANHLVNQGYIDTACALQREVSINLDNFEVADNMDLYYVLQDYESYFEIRFNKKPTMVKKVAEAAKKKSLFSKPPTGVSKPKLGTDSKESRAASKDSKKQSTDKASVKKSKSTVDNIFEIEGKNIEIAREEVKIQESPEDYFENRVLPPLPGFAASGENRDLALSIQREIINSNPGISFKDIIGLDVAKKLMKEAVMLPLKYPQLFTGLLEPWKGILLFGPPGTGKTMMAKAVATQSKTTFFNISASTIVSKWRGDSEKLVKMLFDLARYYQPSTIFIDEIDAVMSARSQGGEHEASRRMKTELLIQLDGLIQSSEERVFLLAASNLPWELDSALLRRLEKRILIPLPEIEARESLVKLLVPPSMADRIDYFEIAGLLEGYSGSDIKLVCKEAAMKPLRRLMDKIENYEDDDFDFTPITDPSKVPRPDPVAMDDFLTALETTKAAAQIIKQEKYQKWMSEFGSV
jgi:katanin p60 ATPase-containing subunit A1